MDSIFTELNGVKYFYLTLIVLFKHSSEFQVLLSNIHGFYFHRVKWSKIFLSNTDSSIYTQFNIFRYCYLILLDSIFTQLNGVKYSFLTLLDIFMYNRIVLSIAI